VLRSKVLARAPKLLLLGAEKAKKVGSLDFLKRGEVDPFRTGGLPTEEMGNRYGGSGRWENSVHWD